TSRNRRKSQQRPCDTPRTRRARERAAQNLTDPPQAPLLPLARRSACQAIHVLQLRKALPGWNGLTSDPLRPLVEIPAGKDNLKQMKKYSTANTGPINGRLILLTYLLAAFISFRLGSE